MSDEQNNDVTPESLMERFKGPKLVKLVVLTVVVHVVVILGSSLPHLIKAFTKTDTSKMSREDKIKLAVEDATVVLREIAEEHGINPQDISDQFGSGGSRSARAADQSEAQAASAVPDDKPTAEEPDKPKSAIEQKLETKAEGPKMPTFEDKKDDIF